MFYTSRGAIQFNCWDTAGQEKGGPLPNDYHDSSCAIIMCDVTILDTYNRPKLKTYYNHLGRRQQNIPIVLCGNKFDIKAESITFPTKENLKVLLPANFLRNNHILRNKEAKKSSILSEKKCCLFSVQFKKQKRIHNLQFLNPLKYLQSMVTLMRNWSNIGNKHCKHFASKISLVRKWKGPTTSLGHPYFQSIWQKQRFIEYISPHVRPN